MANPNIGSVFIDPRAFVESDRIGPGTDINAFAWVMRDSEIGSNCNICGFVTIDEEAVIEDDVTIMNGAYVAQGVTVKRGAYIGPNAVIANDPHPRSPRARSYSKRYEQAETWLRKTIIGSCTSIGANATVICGNDIGDYAMVGAGAVVTRPVEPYALVIGVPARQVGWVNEHGLLTNNQEK